MKKCNKIIALLLACVLLLTTGCASLRSEPRQQQLQSGPQRPVERPMQPAAPTVPAAPAETVPEATFPAPVPAPAPDRESLDQLAQLVMPEDNTEDLTDEELTDLIISEIEEELGPVELPDSGSPEIGPVEDTDYDEAGAMTRPFRRDPSRAGGRRTGPLRRRDPSAEAAQRHHHRRHGGLRRGEAGMRGPHGERRMV